MRLQVVDIETTGQARPAEIIEFGRVDVVRAGDQWEIARPMARLYRPLNGILPERWPCTTSSRPIWDPIHRSARSNDCDTRCGVGRYAGRLGRAQLQLRAVVRCRGCDRRVALDLTYKVALHVWPDAPRHSNQVLRCWHSLVLDPALAMPPHRAGPDAYVTAHLLVELLRHATVEQMIVWTAQPKQLPKLPFGKHRSLAWAEAPLDYLQWMMRQTDMDQDAIWCAGQEVARRLGTP